MEHEQVIRAVALREYGHALSDDEVDAVVWLTDLYLGGYVPYVADSRELPPARLDWSALPEPLTILMTTMENHRLDKVANILANDCGADYDEAHAMLAAAGFTNLIVTTRMAQNKALREEISSRM